MKNIMQIIVGFDESNSKRLSARRKKRYIKIINAKYNKMFRALGVNLINSDICKDYIKYDTLGVNLTTIYSMYFDICNFKSNVSCTNFITDDINDQVTFDIAISNKKIYNEFDLKNFQIEFLAKREKTRELTIQIEKQCRKILSDEYNVNICKHMFNDEKDIVSIIYDLTKKKKIKLAMQLAALLEKNFNLECNIFDYKAGKNGEMYILLTEKA